MTTPRVNKPAANSLDQASREMIYEGLNVTQLEEAFGMDRLNIQRRIVKIKPHAVRGGVAVYRIRDVYSALWKPNAEQVEQAVRRLSHNELPKELTKEFWAGQRSRQDYEFNAGDLWQTTEIVENVGELLKLVKMSTRLFSDTVERQTELTDRQRAIIKSLSDSMLADLSRMMKEKFKVLPNGQEADQGAEEL